MARVAAVNHPPYRVETERLVIRCWEPDDAARLKDAIDTSLDHLRTWIGWAHDEPQSVDRKIELLREFQDRFDAGADFVYGVFAREEDRVLGGTGLHRRVGDDAFEIGYWVRSDAVGRGFATEAAAALTQVAFTVSEVERVEIHVDPRNIASSRIPRKLGYVEEARLRRRLPPIAPGGPKRDVLVFSMLDEEFPSSAAGTAAVVVGAFDNAGERLR
jgi:RimJ/RimL family protein N-acetyltransferase